MITVRSRKKELEQLVSVLESEHDSVEDLAEEVWGLVDNLRRTRQSWVVVVNHGHPLYLAYGIYDTEAAALKDLGKYRSATGGEKAYVLRLTSAGSMFDFSPADFK